MSEVIYETMEINGTETSFKPGMTVLEAALAAGFDIPTLCHDASVEPYGGCGLCLVEAEGARRLLRACSTMAAKGMKIQTHSAKVNRARKAQLEMLLSDHDGDCVAPCQLACPGKTDCQGYVGLIANGMYGEAYKLIMEKLPFPGSIGRVCPHPCETACRRALVEEPINIAALKRFAADRAEGKGGMLPTLVASDTGFKVAIVGGGPAGLTAAYFLRQWGHAVTVFDARAKMGGMLRYGIPEYRLPKAVLDEEIDLIAAMGVDMVNNVNIGTDITLDEIRERFDRVFVGIGASGSAKMNIPGEGLGNVFGGVEFLRGAAEGTITELRGAVAVIGGGDAAMDACRTAVRLGADKVCVAYRRTLDEMPANKHEIAEALEEGVVFKTLRAPLAIEGEDGMAARLVMQVMELGEPDESGRRAPVPVEGETETLAVDAVIAIIGQKVNPSGFDALPKTRRATLSVNERFETGTAGVYAAGDAVNKGPGIAIEAIGAAREAAEYIHADLMGQAVGKAVDHDAFRVESEKTEADFAEREKIGRVNTEIMPPGERVKSFREIMGGLDEEQAGAEASRCLECGCMAVYDCKLLKYSREYGVTTESAAKLTTREKREIADGKEFMRDQNKCVLCRLCVRVCGEVAGKGVIDAAHRGFETVVLPEFGKPFGETDCVFCGQCAAVCPTGALTARMPGKNVPLRDVVTETVCEFCGAGCKVRIGSYAGKVTKVLPVDLPLCRKAREGYAKGEVPGGAAEKYARIVEDIAAREGAELGTIADIDAADVIVLAGDITEYAPVEMSIRRARAKGAAVAHADGGASAGGGSAVETFAKAERAVVVIERPEDWGKGDVASLLADRAKAGRETKVLTL